jgi:hypothetical protein
MFADNIALVNFEDNWKIFKQIVEIDLRYTNDWMGKKSIKKDTFN